MKTFLKVVIGYHVLSALGGIYGITHPEALQAIGQGSWMFQFMVDVIFAGWAVGIFSKTD